MTQVDEDIEMTGDVNGGSAMDQMRASLTELTDESGDGQHDSERTAHYAKMGAAFARSPAILSGGGGRGRGRGRGRGLGSR